MKYFKKPYQKWDKGYYDVDVALSLSAHEEN